MENKKLYNATKAAERRRYMTEYNKKNYENKLKNNKVICTVCEKTYHVTNRWKHNSSKFHNFFKELIEARGLKPKEEELNSETI